MDAFQELFHNSGDNWQQAPETGRLELLERKDNREGDVTSADSTTPPPQQNNEGDRLAKTANSIRGLLYFFFKSNRFKLEIKINSLYNAYNLVLF